MRRLLYTLAVAAALILGGSTLASAGSPHFVGTPTLSVDGSSLTVSGKIAGLGNEEQVDVRLTALAECVNPGGNKPSADNKDEIAADGTFPVQNGKALFSLTATATPQPPCVPPMTLVFSDPLVTDLTHGISIVPQ